MSMSKQNLVPCFSSLDEVQHWVLATILDQGEASSPRGMLTLELFPLSFTLLDSRRRRVLNPMRKWSFPLALGEFCWHVSGSNELQFIEYYASHWREFTEDGATIRGSCYGHRVFNKTQAGTSQWERLVQTLKADPDSRRAVLYFSDSADYFDSNSKDVPCATSLQFVVRLGCLHAITHMRSNDAIWGLPYDVFLFTMLQELLACELGIELGSYSHSVTSIHLYERHFELAKQIVEYGPSEFLGMPKMKNHAQLPLFLKLEAKLRKGEYEINSNENGELDSYWTTLVRVLEEYGRKKHEQKSMISFAA
jgi:thymidylate synthase